MEKHIDSGTALLERMTQLLDGIEADFRESTARIEGALVATRELMLEATDQESVHPREIASHSREIKLEGLDDETRALIEEEVSRTTPFEEPVNDLDAAPNYPEDHYVDRPFTDPMDCLSSQVIEHEDDLESVDYIDMEGMLPLEPASEEEIISEPLFGGTLDIYVDEILKQKSSGELHQNYKEDGSYESTFSPFTMEEDGHADWLRDEDLDNPGPRFQI